MDFTPNEKDRQRLLLAGHRLGLHHEPDSRRLPAHNSYPTKISGISYIHTFSPNIVNEFRAGFTRVRWNNGVPSDPSGQFGLTGDAKVGIPFGNSALRRFHRPEHQQQRQLHWHNANPQVFTDNTFNYEDNVSWSKGGQHLSIGGQATRYQQNYLNAGNVGFLGQFSYSGTFSGNPNASDGPGYGPADFVIGDISNVQLASPLGLVGNRQWRIALYFQDDYKITPRLTSEPRHPLRNRSALVRSA